MAEPAPDGGLSGETSTGVDARLSALLCYTAWWVSGLVFLVLEQQHRAVRFHAAQSLVLFGGLSLLIAILSGISVAMLLVSATAFQATRTLAEIVWVLAVVIWLVMMIKTFKYESWRIPLVAEFADRLAGR